MRKLCGESLVLVVLAHGEAPVRSRQVDSSADGVLGKKKLPSEEIQK